MKGKMRKSNNLRGIILSMVMVLIAVFAFSAVFVQSAGADDQSAQNVSLMVKLVNGLTPDEQTAVIARNGGVEISSIPALRLHIVELPASELSDTLTRYQADSQVQSVEINNKRKVEGTPTDPLLPGPMGLAEDRMGHGLWFGRSYRCVDRGCP